jgi:DNA primase
MNHVLELLKKHNIYYTEAAKDYVVRCLNPEHDDSSPSLRIDKVTGKMHCFACGYKVNIFSHFGVVANHTSIKIAGLKEKLAKLVSEFNGVTFPVETVPFTRQFRGISAKTLKEFGAFYTTAKEELSDRIFFPVTDVSGNVVVFVGRHTLSQGNPRYLNYPSGVTMPIFPEVIKGKHSSVVLVEGVFDLLNLYDKGVTNVCCTFGTSTLFKNTASKLLSLKVQGITKIYLMYDGDKPGKDAAAKLKPLIEECDYEVEIITLEDDTDPGELSQEDVDSIKEYIK